MNPYHSLWGNQSFFSPKDHSTTLPDRQSDDWLPDGWRSRNGVVIPGSGFPSAASARAGRHSERQLPASLPRLVLTIRRRFTAIFSPFRLRLPDRASTVKKRVGRYIQRLGISDTVHVGGNSPFQLHFVGNKRQCTTQVAAEPASAGVHLHAYIPGPESGPGT